MSAKKTLFPGCYLSCGQCMPKVKSRLQISHEIIVFALISAWFQNLVTPLRFQVEKKLNHVRQKLRSLSGSGKVIKTPCFVQKKFRFWWCLTTCTSFGAWKSWCPFESWTRFPRIPEEKMQSHTHIWCLIARLDDNGRLHHDRLTKNMRS